MGPPKLECDNAPGDADGSRRPVYDLDFRALLHAMPGPWVVLGADAPRFTILEVNESYSRAAMRSPGELLGRGVFDAMPDANPRDRERNGEANVRASLERVIRTRSPHRMPIQRYDAQRPDGGWEEYHWQALHTPVLGAGGEVVCILETLENLTARVVAERAAHAAERQLRMAFQQAPALVAVTAGPDHRFVLANPLFQDMVGRDDLVGRTVRDALPELQDQDVPAVYDRVFETGEPHVANERRVLSGGDGEDARERWYNTVYQPLHRADGVVAGILQHAVDVTGQVRARMEMQQARDEAEAANRAKGQFLAVMSHELRTPLNAISGYADILEMGVHGPVTEAQRKAIGRIQSSQKHLLGLINDVLNYAKLETGGVHYEITSVPVQHAFASVEALVAPQVRAAGLALRECEDASDLAVRADPEKLTQILLNLLSNAIKFGKPEDGEGHIDLGCAAEDRWVHLTVSDTGVGISRDKLATIFEPFVQVRADLTRTAEGTGLGLAISRDLARGMGGDLRVESELGSGSTFTLTLPRA